MSKQSPITLDYASPDPSPKRQSVWGTASLMIGLMAVACLAGFLLATDAMVAGFVFGMYLTALLCGFACGLLGVRHVGRRKGISIAGLILNATLLGNGVVLVLRHVRF